MPQTATSSNQATQPPTYTLVLIEHDGKNEREISLDQGTPEEVRAFITAARKQFPLIVV